MPRQSKKEDAQFNGKLTNIKQFKAALEDIQTKYQITPEKTVEILLSSIDKAYRDTNFSTKNLKIKNDQGELISQSNSQAIHSQTVIDQKTGEIIFYLCKDVIEDDDITDDLYQISPEDANKQDPSHDYVVGDIFKEKHTLENQQFSFFTRAMQNFSIKLKEAGKQLLIEKYTDKVGKIVNAVVESTDFKTGNTYLLINQVPAILLARNTISGEHFLPGQTIKVLLKSIGDSKTGEKGTSLVVTRTDELFLQRLFEEEIPDLADGSVKIEKIAREAGVRSKVAVSSEDPNIDPSGACIGSDGSRIKDINSEICNEKIDVIKYYENKYLYIAEALKPALVIGVVLKDNEPVEPGKAPKAIAIVKNDDSRVAIGKGGINVKLASKLTGYSIDVKELDVAMGDHIQYVDINEIKRKEALERLEQESLAIEDEEEDEEDTKAAEEYVRNNSSDELKQQVNQVENNVVETNKPVEEEVEEPKEEKVEEKEVEKEVEHIEITTKAKVSISELEAQIEEEKKANKQQSTPKFKKDSKKEEKKEEKKVISNAMPIYTEEELQQMEEEEQEDQNQEDEDYSEYDDDQYYDNN